MMNRMFVICWFGCFNAIERNSYIQGASFSQVYEAFCGELIALAAGVILLMRRRRKTGEQFWHYP